jgi:hypothetical protein
MRDPVSNKHLEIVQTKVASATMGKPTTKTRPTKEKPKARASAEATMSRLPRRRSVAAHQRGSVARIVKA